MNISATKVKSRKNLVSLIFLALVSFNTVFISGCSDSQNQSNFIPLDGMTRLTDDTITQTIKNSTGYLLVHFTSYDQNCGYCVDSNPYVDNLMYSNKNKLKVARISWEPWTSHAHESKAIKKEYWITGIPMFAMYKDGEEFWRGTGNTVENKIKLAEILGECCN